jgi:hypothetical protein
MPARDCKGLLHLQYNQRGHSQKLMFYEGINLVGRGPAKADVLIKDASISEAHAQVICRGGTITIVDLNSKNGVYVWRPPQGNGRILPNQEIEIDPAEDVVYFGAVRCKVVPHWLSANQQGADTKRVTPSLRKSVSNGNVSQNTLKL